MGSSQTKTRRRGEHEDLPAPSLSSARGPAPRLASGDRVTQAPGGAGGTGAAATEQKGAALPSTAAPALTGRGAERLSRALLAKSLAEALFLVALVVLFSYSHFNPRFRGALDAATAGAVEGWAVDESAPGSQVEVQLFIDGHFVAQRRADRPRPDLLAARRAPRAEHGFRFETPPLPAREAEYEARVFALHATGDPARRTLQQVGNAARFRVAANDENRGAPEAWRESPPKP